MTGLFGWVPDVDHGGTPVPWNVGSLSWRTLAAMGGALPAHSNERWALHVMDGIGLGVLDGIEPGRVDDCVEPAISADGQHALWLAGEIFEAGDNTPARPQDAATKPARLLLLEHLIRHGVDGLRGVDGEFQIAWWQRRDRRLLLLSDRFGAMPWYWARGDGGVAFASGVRGVLMAPGVSRAPDREALRDAVTFGGFRLATHTNVESVRMLPGAAVGTIANGSLHVTRWWRWSDIGEEQAMSRDEAIEGAHQRWQKAIARRLRGATRPGQTLSGGLDSRAILAEAMRQSDVWSAITYGVPGCEDGRLAQAAARSVGAAWSFQPLYQDGWLETRASHIQQSDGLIELADLMHMEALPLQQRTLDVHLSGYIGDAVAGPTFNDIDTPEKALIALPYYETALGRGWSNALARVAAATEDPAWLATRFVPFEHKLPQSTNRWSAAWRPWIRVRKPFTDYEFFDFCQRLPATLRGPDRFYEHWLRRKYPGAFARIPNHTTGAPAAPRPWQITTARMRRVARRSWIAAATRFGMNVKPWARAFHDEHRAWSAPAVRSIIESTILRPESIAVDEWGAPVVKQLLDAWFDHGEGPTQVVGALFVFESYHAGLPAQLSAPVVDATRHNLVISELHA